MNNIVSKKNEFWNFDRREYVAITFRNLFLLLIAGLTTSETFKLFSLPFKIGLGIFTFLIFMMGVIIFPKKGAK